MLPVGLNTHRELHTSRRIRLAFDFLYEYLSEKNAGERIEVRTS